MINGKDCGIPQSRERVFAISIRKDIDNGKYEFPVPFDIGIRLKDVLEDQVDERYYLSDEKVQEFLKTMDLSHFRKEDNELHQLGYINDYNGDANRIYSDNVARTLKSEAGGGGAKTGWYAMNNESITGLISNQGTKFEKKTEYANTLLVRDYKGFGNQAMNAVISGLFDMIRIRKLTLRECYRLMGLTLEDCEKATELGVADTHLYKQAGNGIITNCCALLAEHLYKSQYDNTYICTDEEYQGNFTKPQAK